MMRRAAAWIGTGALLFAQLAVPVHACPMAFADEAAMTMPCDSMPPASGVCHEHAREGAQAVDQSAGNACFDAFVPAFVATVPVARAMPLLPGIATAAAVHPTAPPLYLRNCSLRF